MLDIIADRGSARNASTEAQHFQHNVATWSERSRSLRRGDLR
jgi:hypothetical protein